MDALFNCGANGWAMISAAVAAYALLALIAAALIKYLFFAKAGSAAA